MPKIMNFRGNMCAYKELEEGKGGWRECYKYSTHNEILKNKKSTLPCLHIPLSGKISQKLLRKIWNEHAKTLSNSRAEL